MNIYEQMNKMKGEVDIKTLAMTNLHLQAVLRAACTGIDEPRIRFDSSNTITVAGDTEISYDDLLEHDDIGYGSDYIYDYTYATYAYFGDIQIRKNIDYEAKIPKDVMHTLRDLGFVRMNPGFASTPSESIVCERHS